MQIINKFYKLLNVYIYFILFSLLIVFFSTTYSNANAFKVSDIEISSPFELNFEKNNVIDKGFQTSFSDLISMITTSGDRKKIENISVKELKGMIDSFTISDEKFINNEYFANLETTFNKKKILKFLANENIFPSIPQRNKVLLFPILIETKDNSIYLFNNNIFYDKWNEQKNSYRRRRRVPPPPLPGHADVADAACCCQRLVLHSILVLLTRCQTNRCRYRKPPDFSADQVRSHTRFLSR